MYKSTFDQLINIACIAVTFQSWTYYTQQQEYWPCTLSWESDIADCDLDIGEKTLSKVDQKHSVFPALPEYTSIFYCTLDVTEITIRINLYLIINYIIQSKHTKAVVLAT